MKSRMRKRLIHKSIVTTLVSIVAISSLSLFAGNSTGQTKEDAIWNKTDNTSFITSKNAEWVSPNDYLAELSLTINGTQKVEDLDVVIVLDRSGSMDMTYIGNRDDHSYSPTYGYPLSSGPCLNPDHFYLAPVVRKISGLDPTKTYQMWRTFSTGGSRDITVKYYENIPQSLGGLYTGWAADNIPTNYIGLGLLTGNLLNLDVLMDAPFNNKVFKESLTGATVYYDSNEDQWYEYNYSIAEPEVNPDIQKGYDIGNGKLAVYKEDYHIWVEVDRTNHIHQYYQFDDGKLIPNHFKIENGEYRLISYWDETIAGGTWVHGDEDEGCYDRWIEAKRAVSKFTETILVPSLNNTVSLVPFSVRDNTMVDFLNGANGAPLNHKLRQRIIEQVPGAFDLDVTGVSVDSSNQLSGTYKSTVDWTQDATKVTDMLSRLFTTGNTDYMYGLSMAYNQLYQRSPEAKANRHSIVIFISDGVPYPMSNTSYVPGSGSIISSFLNSDVNITGLANAIKSDADFVSDGDFFKDYTGLYQRHDINPAYLLTNSNNVVGVPGLGAEIVTIGFMIQDDTGTSKTRLENLATTPSQFYNIPASSDGSVEGLLTEQLMNSLKIPGGRESVLYDDISQYFYVPDDWNNPYDNVRIEGTQDGPQRVVWTLNDIYSYLPENEPIIKVPLVLREAYRNIDVKTYYPTNNDPNPNLYEPSREPDNAKTGAKLYYKDFNETWRYDTIGTPKLPVLPVIEAPVSLSLKKQLVDQNNQLVGTGEVFKVKLYDHDHILIGDYSLHANQDAVVVEGLKKDQIYYLKEDIQLGYNLKGYEIIGLGEFQEGINGVEIKTDTPNPLIEIIVKNEVEVKPNTVSLSLKKQLVDQNNQLVGTGEVFKVKLYDHDHMLIGDYSLHANQDAVVVEGLKQGYTYYIVEEQRNGYTFVGYDIQGVDNALVNQYEIKIDTSNTYSIELLVKNKQNELPNTGLSSMTLVSQLLIVMGLVLITKKRIDIK